MDLEVFLILNSSTRELARSAAKAFALLRNHTLAAPFQRIAERCRMEACRQGLETTGVGLVVLVRRISDIFKENFDNLFPFYFRTMGEKWNHLVNDTANEPHKISVFKDCKKAISGGPGQAEGHSLKVSSWRGQQELIYTKKIVLFQPF